VPSDLLAERSAVCRDVAIAMAEGPLARSPAGVAIAITGVAGPAPDEDGNPVGLIHVAVQLRTVGGRDRELRLPTGHRDELRDRAVRAALDLAIEVLGSSKDS
jgi:nicotinamide-nucleotide amidase